MGLNLHGFLNGLFVVNGCLALLTCIALFLTLATIVLGTGGVGDTGRRLYCVEIFTK